MTIRLTAYDTLVGSGYQIEKTQHAVAEALAMGQGFEPLNAHALQLIGGQSMTQAIPAFGHPLLLGTPTDAHTHDAKNDWKLVVDVRGYGEVDPYQKTFKLRVRTEYDFQILRTQLNTAWIQDSPTVLQRLSSLPLHLFAGWFSENLTKHYALTPKEKASLDVLAGILYLSNFTDNTPFDQMSRNRWVMTLSQGLGLPPSLILPVLDRFEQPLSGLLEFCENVQPVTESVRFKGFNPGILLPLLGGTWFGSNREVIGVATEHPPTWLAMVVSAAQDRTYKNTDIHRRLERIDRHEKGAQLIRAVQALVHTLH